MNCIRNYIYKSPIQAIQEKDMFGVPILQTIFKIFEQAYRMYTLVYLGKIGMLARFCRALQSSSTYSRIRGVPPLS